MFQDCNIQMIATSERSQMLVTLGIPGIQERHHAEQSLAELKAETLGSKIDKSWHTSGGGFILSIIIFALGWFAAKKTQKSVVMVPIRRPHWTVDFAHGAYLPFNPLMSMVFPLPDEISKKLRWMTIAKPFVKVIEPQDFHPGGTLTPCFTWNPIKIPLKPDSNH